MVALPSICVHAIGALLLAFHRFIKSKEEEEFDVPPWEDPRTFGPGGPLHTPPKPPEPGQPFIDPKAGDDLGEAACGSPDAAGARRAL